jgi:hypothetical protein
MILKERQNAFVQTGMFIKQHYGQRPASDLHLHEGLEKVIQIAFLNNGWFSPNFVNNAIQSIGSMLNEASISLLCKDRETNNPKTIALICAGNIPMVGFHDFMCVLLSGHRMLLKMSSDDNVLMPFFIRLLIHFEPRFQNLISIADGKLRGFDAIIATGSNNTSTYFQYYFGKYPNIIRKNRTSLAVLTGKESAADLKNLGKDIFFYYGLGCRNAGKLLVPQGYDFKLFFESIIEYGFVIDNNKYANNYDYHRALFLLEQQAFLDNNFLIVKESGDLHSPVATLYYSYYKDYSEAKTFLEANKEQLQCVIGAEYIPFGYSQHPVITDFADNINTYEFLLSL